MARREFTEERVAALPHKGNRYEVSDGTIPGFSVVVGLRDKSFAFRYRLGGKAHKLTFPYTGPGGNSLEEARSKAREARGLVKQGKDPKPVVSDAPSALQQSNKIEDVLEEFLSKHLTKRNGEPFRETTKDRRRQNLEGVIAHWPGLEVQDLTRRHIRELLDGILAREVPSMARHTLANLKTFLSWAVEREIIPVSPAAAIRSIPPRRSIGRALSEEELVLVWNAAERLGYPFGSLVQLLLLTGQRRQEGALLQRGHLDIAKGIWTQPVQVIKTGKDQHLVPLSPQALGLLEGLPRECEPWVFAPHGFGITSNYPDGKRELDALLPEGMAPWRVHDLRHTLKTKMQEWKVPKEVRNAVQNHTSGDMDATYGHWSFFPEKKETLERWANYIDGLTGGASGATVTYLRRA